ncbi:hypothetical protein Dvar_23470 [Desulfosarcina variabilis str. Montpellier]|uniref:BREX-1 system adenine-specific DNA-methyltransferase PglX n=1 Tax=Desulfosarcina variabilis TaxID=2300 RepID=UPI003AFA9360
MAFDTDTRNKLAKLVADARTLLNNDFTEQLQEIFGIQPDGKMTAMDKLTHLDDYQRETARILRERVAHLASGMKTEKKPLTSAVDRMTREQSFTMLNRFAALRMCEERGLLQQCVGGGLNAKGFQVYQQTAGSALGGQYERYRTFLFCVFDEIAVDLGILFDRFSSFGLLFPRESALIELLEIINREELKHIWVEDETIGWIYQYFNSPEERKAMRKASTAPRNTRELAVRNQFFTPRYVVEFLTDNTLGRIWYEMRKGDTALKDECRYLVRRPNEVFLEANEKAPAEAEGQTELSHEELVKQTVYIEHRPKKDPRDIRVLDPACGSGHFLLYAFDLLERIYEEAWEDFESPSFENTGRTLQEDFEDFETLDDLRREVPKLIMVHNLHGIDIDPRSVQIAALALWLRAQKTWKNFGLKASERPRVAKSNIVTAEPMPGEAEIKEEFTAGLKPRVFGQLVDAAFEKMKLAGEAGSLLKIEEEIKDVVSEAKAQWLNGPRHEQQLLFPKMGDQKPKQQVLQFDFKGFTDEGFWEQVEDRILDALQKYAQKAENGRTVLRRLFAKDAARGFAFIDLCRKHYDVVLMNPPFGDRVLSCNTLFEKEYGNGKFDLYHYFYERAESVLNNSGRIGAITPRTLLYQSRYIMLRRKWLEGLMTPSALAELDLGVLDTATVRPLLVVLELSSMESNTFYKNLKHTKSPDVDLLQAVQDLKRGELDSGSTFHRIARFSEMPGERISLWAPEAILDAFRKYPTLEPEEGKVTEGLSNEDDLRFLRCWWETPADGNHHWRAFGKFDSRSTFFADFSITIDWSKAGYYALGERGNRRANEKYYFNAGIAFTRSCEVGMAATVLPKDLIFAGTSRYFIQNPSRRFGLLAYLNSRFAEALHLILTPDRDRISGTLRKIPVCIDNGTLAKIGEIGKQVWRKKFSWVTERDETLRQAGNVIESYSGFGCLQDQPAYAKDKKSEVENLEGEIESILIRSLPFQDHDLQVLEKEVRERSGEKDLVAWNDVLTSSIGAASCLISVVLGTTFGRWDIRSAIGEHQPQELPDPFAPLPICPPGMLQNIAGLPAEPEDLPADYPLRIPWSGILVDDKEHFEDIVARVRETIEAIWQNRAEAIEQETCDILGVSDLRNYFCKPAKFFQDHLKRYSKTRRKAPIYWPLSTASGSYTLWIYYYRLTDQTLYSCIQDYVDPKIKDVSDEISNVQIDLGEGGNTKLRDQLEKLMDFQQELTEFKDELLRVAKLPYQPNLNDGVMITAAPLWRLFQLKSWQKELKNCWDKLEAGEYNWAHLAYSIWPEKVRETCKKDRSIAIAHGLEEICEVEAPKKAKKRKKRTS